MITLSRQLCHKSTRPLNINCPQKKEMSLWYNYFNLEKVDSCYSNMLPRSILFLRSYVSCYWGSSCSWWCCLSYPLKSHLGDDKEQEERQAELWDLHVVVACWKVFSSWTGRRRWRKTSRRFPTWRASPAGSDSLIGCEGGGTCALGFKPAVWLSKEFHLSSNCWVYLHQGVFIRTTC